MPPTAADLYDIAKAFLDASITALNQTTEGAPERAFVNAGEPALDCCPQLTVYTQALTEANLAGGSGGLSAPHKINRGGLAQTTLSIMIARCVPTQTEKNGKWI